MLKVVLVVVLLEVDVVVPASAKKLKFLIKGSKGCERPKRAIYSHNTRS